MSGPARFGQVLGLGAGRGARAFLKLMMVVAPVYTGVTVLRYTPAIRVFAEFMAPAMRWFGLPGEAALAVILGNVVNLYAGLGAITALRLPGNQLTVLALMLLISHSQILETAVFFRIRATWWLLWAIRLVVAGLAGFGLARVLVEPGAIAGGGTAAVALAETAQIPFVGMRTALMKWGLGLADTGLKMLLVLVGIFALLELARRYGLLEKVLAGLRRVIGFMGYSKEAGMPWLAGNVFGIVFGAGLIVESVEQVKLSSRQVMLVATFLALCHGLFEDTAIFIVLGANLFWIVVPRIVLAVAATWLLSRILRGQERKELK